MMALCDVSGLDPPSAWQNLRRNVSFQSMRHSTVEHRSSVSWRQTLSAHFTKSCGPQRKAPCISLHACGLDDVREHPGGQYQVIMSFPNLLEEGDQLLAVTDVDA